VRIDPPHIEGVYSLQWSFTKVVSVHQCLSWRVLVKPLAGAVSKLAVLHRTWQAHDCRFIPTLMKQKKQPTFSVT
jgi:hypothetical protein